VKVEQIACGPHSAWSLLYESRWLGKWIWGVWRVMQGRSRYHYRRRKIYAPWYAVVKWRIEGGAHVTPFQKIIVWSDGKRVKDDEWFGTAQVHVTLCCGVGGSDICWCNLAWGSDVHAFHFNSIQCLCKLSSRDGATGVVAFCRKTRSMTSLRTIRGSDVSDRIATLSHLISHVAFGIW